MASEKRIHLIGAGGIGLSAVGKLLISQGRRVSGSDLSHSDITRDLAARGAEIFPTQDAENIGPDVAETIYSSAVPAEHPERVRARELGIPERSYPEFLGDMSKEYETVVVTGTNGKSTTTAMLGRILEDAGMDPTVIVGSLVPGWPLGNLRIGKGKHLVVEGCEYREHMNLLHPVAAVITNIEEDHLDYYRDLAHIQDAFQSFADKLADRGFVVTNADDPVSRSLAVGTRMTFGLGSGAEYSPATHPLELSIPGEYNLANALAATAGAMELGVSFESCARTIKAFRGIWRRFERVGAYNGAEIISDYGHHPTAVRGLIRAAREAFPTERLVLCFQPHQHSRTLEMKDEFIDALADVAKDAAVIVPEIYGVVGRTEKEASMVSSRDLVDGVKARMPEADIRYAADLDEAEAMLRETLRTGDVALIQGAGEVDRIARNLCKA